MKLHVTPGSPNCRKIEAALKFYGRNIEIVSVDIFSGAHKTPEYMALNPNGKLPILEDGSLVLWESNAILHHLFTDQDQEPARRAEILRWQFWEAAHYGKAVGTLVWERFAKPKFGLGAKDAAAEQSAMDAFHQLAPVLSTHLNSRAFVLGDTPSIADFALASQAAYLDAADVPYREYPDLAAWYDRLDGIPAWHETRPDFGG